MSKYDIFTALDLSLSTSDGIMDDGAGMFRTCDALCKRKGAGKGFSGSGHTKQCQSRKIWSNITDESDSVATVPAPTVDGDLSDGDVCDEPIIIEPDTVVTNKHSDDTVSASLLRRMLIEKNVASSAKNSGSSAKNSGSSAKNNNSSAKSNNSSTKSNNSSGEKIFCYAGIGGVDGILDITDDNCVSMGASASFDGTVCPNICPFPSQKKRKLLPKIDPAMKVTEVTVARGSTDAGKSGGSQVK